MFSIPKNEVRFEKTVSENGESGRPLRKGFSSNGTGTPAEDVPEHSKILIFLKKLLTNRFHCGIMPDVGGRPEWEFGPADEQSSETL